MIRDRGRPGVNISPQVLREARLRQQDGEWLSSAKAVVLRRYRGKYAAIRNRRVVAASNTMKGLYAKLGRLNPGMVLITRVEKPTRLVVSVPQNS